MGRILLSLFLFHSTASAWANSCCGQSPASFSVLALGQKLSLTSGWTFTESQGRMFGDSDEFFVWERKQRQVQSFTLNLATSVTDRQQLFMNLSHLRGSFEEAGGRASSQHPSDTLLGYSYEVLPEYSFSVWKPRVFVSALISAPTGRSIYDPNRLSEGADVTGHNQWGAGFGITLMKVYFPLTLTVQARSLYLFQKSFAGVEVSSSTDNSMALLASYATPWWNLIANTGITMNHLSPRRIQPSGIRSGESLNFTLLAGLQRPLTEHWFVGLNLSDQTLIGPARNTLLNRSLNFNLNYLVF